ncbi:hypothetical protein DVH05_008482 [Phytophthora capsici]|nr:hypothetical protein DVH05_008482 [Phytophthora capsici]
MGKKNSQVTQNSGPTTRSRLDDSSSIEPRQNTPCRQTLAGCTSSVNVAQFEPLRSIPGRLPSAGRTSSVDAAQFEPLRGKANDHLGAGHTNIAEYPTASPQNHHPSAGCIGSDHGQSVPSKNQYSKLESNPRPHSRYVRDQLAKQLAVSATNRLGLFNKACTQLGIPPPAQFPLRTNKRQWQLNKETQRVVTAMALDHGMCLHKIVELVRGQSKSDFRPNKALCPTRLGQLLDGYKHKDLLISIAREGIQPSWRTENPVRTRPVKNHGPASRHLNGVLKALRKGQDEGQYLILDIAVLECWGDIQVSPLGAVPKKDCDPNEDIRLIHDLSFPRGSSTNDVSMPNSSPEIE